MENSWKMVIEPLNHEHMVRMGDEWEPSCDLTVCELEHHHLSEVNQLGWGL